MAGDKKTFSCGIGHCFLHDHSIMVAKIVLVFFVICCLLISCAPAHKTMMSPPIQLQPPSQTADKNIITDLKAFRLEILAVNHGLCLRDGKNMIFLGRDSSLQLVLKFTQIPDVKPDDLVARIAHLSFPFALRSSEKVFMTDITNLDSLEPGLDTGTTGISIFKGRDGEIFLGTQEMLVIDTTPPPKPTNFKVKERGADHFSLSWESGKGDIKEYLVQKWDSGRWLTLRSGFSSPFVSIESKPEGRFRIVAVDCALNRAVSEEIILDQGRYLSVTETGRGERRCLAYRIAQILIDYGFVRKYVSPWLEANTDFTKNEINTMITERLEGWVPPGIRYTPENETQYYREEGKWCTKVTGKLDRNSFNNWIRRRPEIF
jgi:hypothetical protein